MVLLELDFAVGDEVPAFDVQPRDFGVFGSAAHQPPVDGAIAIAQLAADLADRDGALDRGNRLDDPRVVFPQQAIGQDEAGVVAGNLQGLLRADHDVVGPQALDLLLGLDADPFADGQQPDHAGDADEDPQHRQQRPQGVHEQALDAQLPGSEEEHHQLRVSDCSLPSRRRIIRLARAATSFSCVTMMIVLPIWFRLSNKRRISSAVAESRFPVGSSARMK